MDEMMNPVPAEPVVLELQEEKKEVSKPFSLRLGEDSVQAFREWCDQEGLSQADGFANLIKMLELQKTKDLIPNRQKEVENFQSLLTSMTDAFLHSLELNENAETRIRQSLQQQLETKDQAIADYQESARKQNEKVKELKEKAELVDGLQKEIEELKKNVEQRDNQLKDKDELNLILTEKLAKAESMENEVATLKQALGTKDDEITELEKQIEVEKATCQTEKLKAAQAEKDTWMEKLQQERNAWQAEKDALKDKLQADLHAAIDAAQEKRRESEDKLRDKIAELEKEAGKHEKELELLRQDNKKKAQTIQRITGSYNALRDEYRNYKKEHPVNTEKQENQTEDPDQLTLDDVTND